VQCLETSRSRGLVAPCCWIDQRGGAVLGDFAVTWFGPWFGRMVWWHLAVGSASSTRCRQLVVQGAAACDCDRPIYNIRAGVHTRGGAVLVETLRCRPSRVGIVSKYADVWRLAVGSTVAIAID
jgi:hypothetical protein